MLFLLGASAAGYLQPSILLVARRRPVLRGYPPRPYPYASPTRPSPSARLRRTRPTLKKISPPPSATSAIARPLPPAAYCRPYGVKAAWHSPLPGGSGRQRAGSTLWPPQLASPFVNKNNSPLRSYLPNGKKTPPLRRSGSFGFGRRGRGCGCLASRLRSAPPLLLRFCLSPPFSGLPAPSAPPPLPKALPPAPTRKKRWRGGAASPYGGTGFAAGKRYRAEQPRPAKFMRRKAARAGKGSVVQSQRKGLDVRANAEVVLPAP